MTHVFTSMIEPKLTFFKIQIKSRFGKSSELGESHTKCVWLWRIRLI